MNKFEITVKDVLECVGENINPAKDISGNPSSGVETRSNEDGSTSKVTTTEFSLTRNFFENLGILMQEYLTTTTLGDLQRKSREVNANSAEASPIEATSPVETVINNEMSSVIRPIIGEINQ